MQIAQPRERLLAFFTRSGRIAARPIDFEGKLFAKSTPTIGGYPSGVDFGTYGSAFVGIHLLRQWEGRHRLRGIKEQEAPFSARRGKSVLHAFDPAGVAGNTRGGIDTVDYIDGLPGLVTHPQPTTVPHGAPLLVSGWTVDPSTDGPALAVCVLLDGVRPLDAQIGIARGDIMLEHKTEEFVGYQIVVGTDDLGPGAHELRTYALSADGFWYESAAAGFRLYRRAFPEKETLSRGLQMFLDRVVVIGAETEVPSDTPIRANRWMLFQGWAFDNVSRGGAATIAAFDDAGRMWSGPSTIERPDVRASKHASDDRLGFEIAIPAAVFERGPHRLRFIGYDEAGRRYANSLEAPIEIITAERPFPLTARALPAPPVCAAQLRQVTESTSFRQTLPARTLVEVDGDAELIVEGWALDKTGAAAEEVFIELAASGIHIPPQRLATECALRACAEDIADAPPVDNAWFRFTFRTAGLQPADYDLALVVVQPGRQSYARVALATLRVTETITD